MNRKEKAGEYFKKGYNCSQSVLAAFCEDLNLSEEQALKLASAFGGGLARTRGQCGAVTAMAMVIGMLKSETSGDINANNGEVYELTRKALDEFRLKNGSIVCGELLKNVKDLTKGGAPDKRTEEYYKIRPCSKFVFDVVDYIERFYL